MNQAAPAPTAKPASPKKRPINIGILVLLAICFAFISLPVMFVMMKGGPLITRTQEATPLSVLSVSGKFEVKVLAITSTTNVFAERVKIRCEGNMRAGIFVTNLKDAGIFKTNGPAREIIYREGQPHKIGGSVDVKADGKFSTCDIFFEVNTTSTNTGWHDEMAGSTLDTSLPVPLTVSDLQTNWPDAYERHSAIPLANLGDYKILLSVQ